MIQEIHGIQSTNPTDGDHLHLTICQDKRRTYVFADCLPITRKLYRDPTGRFLAISTNGNKCILVVYNYNSNTIHAQDMTNGTKQSQFKAYNEIIS